MTFRNKSVSVHQFAMVPRQDVPRSVFMMEHGYKTALNSGYLVPVYCEEVLPGDSFKVRATVFARMATPIYPIMDNLHAETFFFFVPYRLVWSNFVKMMGEQANPGDSISYTVPQMVSKASGYDVGSLHDYFGLPTLGQVQAAATFSHSALPLRAYNLIYNTWFKDENMQNNVVVDLGDAASVYTDYSLLRRGKRRDYFTSALPWPQKGTAVTLPLGTTAPVIGLGKKTQNFAAGGATRYETTGATTYAFEQSIGTSTNDQELWVKGTAAASGLPAIYADLSQATAATINAIRLAVQTQEYLEKDARGGTRYVEKIESHFGVRSPDARLQRPEYLGGGSTPINISAIAQTTATGLTGGSTPLGQLSAFGTFLARGHGFTQSFVEHGIVIGLLNVRADLTYQQGLPRWWSRSTALDFYWPVFEALGEQAILNKELYCRGDANDALVFGYQERWAEYKYHPSQITGILRSTAASTLDAWHLAQKFTSLPTLNTTFIQDTPPVNRVIAVPSQPEFIVDVVFSNKAARPMHMYSIPQLSSHL